MRKKLFTILTISLLSLSIVGCNDNNNASNDRIETILNSLYKGVHLIGSINEEATFLTGYNGTITDEKASTKYDIDYTYENREVTGLERKVYAYEADESRYEWANDLLVEGEDGYAYYNELSYDNTIVNVAASNGSGLDVNYGYFCDNPFRYLNSSDFEKIDDNTYELERKKASHFASKLFSPIDDVFDEVIKKATFTFDKDILTKIEIEPVQIEAYDTFGIDNRYYLLDTKVELNVSDIGTASIKRLETKPHKDEHNALNEAFDKIQDNYTLNIAYDFKLDNVEQETIYYQFYYTKDGLFWKCDNLSDPTEADLLIKYNEDGTTTPYAYDVASQSFTTSAAQSNYGSLFNAPKELYIPLVKEVAAEVFNYNSENQEYHICDELKTFIGIECFIPSCVAIRELNGYGTDCVVKLDNNSLSEVAISYYRRDSFSDETGTFTLTYSNVGTTVLPYSFS